MHHLHAFIVLVVSLIVLHEVAVVGGAHTNEICTTVLDETERLNSADTSFIFRCRLGDDCGGIGDRLGGVMGGAFYALLTGRTFRLLWPGLEHVFQPGRLNWTFDANALNVPYEDSHGQEIDKSRIRDVNGNQILHPFSDRPDVVVVNDLNTRQVNNDTLSAVIDAHRHVFFHSNRGPTEDEFKLIHKKYEWEKHFPATKDNYAAVYRCMFEGLFRPTKEFLSSEYNDVSRAGTPFSRIVRALHNPHFTSMAFHHRVDDGTAEANSQAEVVSSAAMTKMLELRAKHAVPGKSMNLFFVTNSKASIDTILKDRRMTEAFHTIHCQDLSATIHVNSGTGSGEHASHASVLSTLQAMRDWWIMRLVNVLVLYQSGFSKSAALLAPAEQVLYLDGGNTPRLRYWDLCEHRFC